MAQEDGPTTPQEGVERGRDREERALERHARAVARAVEDREKAEALPHGPERDQMEHAVRTHERAAELHDEAARLHRLHQEHEDERGRDEGEDG